MQFVETCLLGLQKCPREPHCTTLQSRETVCGEAACLMDISSRKLEETSQVKSFGKISAIVTTRQNSWHLALGHGPGSLQRSCKASNWDLSTAKLHLNICLAVFSRLSRSIHINRRCLPKNEPQIYETSSFHKSSMDFNSHVSYLESIPAKVLKLFRLSALRIVLLGQPLFPQLVL